ncbi:hypothetical protein BJ742DRAFT_223771 [Cladochytrium replicatum]|nr:hypothetical protein BJ742DRAFT_223771 [Cladochytrium replicatum]
MLCLMTLVESFFKRSKDERPKTKFQTISQETRVTREEVEHLVMRALSLGLLKGKIDEVDGIIELRTPISSTIMRKLHRFSRECLTRDRSRLFTLVCRLECEGQAQGCEFGT